MLNPGPGITRVVTECTQPQGAPPVSEALRLLEKYLSDVKCVDLVYRAVLSRACTQPQSEAVIAKAVDLLKQHLARYRPSTEVLLELESFCLKVYSSAALISPSLRKSISFLNATIKRLGGAELAAARCAPSPASQATSITNSPRVSFNGILSSTEALPLPGRSAIAQPLLPESSAGDRLGSSLDSASRSSSGPVEHGVATAAAAAAAMPPVLAPPGALLLPSQSLARHQQQRSLKWAAPSSAAQARFGLACSTCDPAATTGWTSRLPAYLPSLPALSVASGAAAAEEAALGSQQVLQSFVDADAGAVAQQVWEIGDALRMQASHGVDLSQQQGARRSGTKLLFHHQAYAQQEALNIGDPEMAFVVGVVCGRAAASALSDTAAAAAGVPDGGLQSGQQDGPLYQMCSCILIKLIMDAWLKSGPAVVLPLVLRMLQKALAHSSPTIQARAFDLLYNLSVHASMLLEGVEPQQMQQQPQQQHGHSVHSSTALGQPGAFSPHEGGGLSSLPSPRSSGQPLSPRMGGHLSPRLNTLVQPLSPSRLSRQDPFRTSLGSTAAAGAAAEASPWAQRSLAPACPSPLANSQASSLAEQPSSSSTSYQQTCAKMDRWLGKLLSELLTMLCGMSDVPEAVWTAAAGCLVHLTTHGGHFVAARVDCAPPAALAKLLRCCQLYGWSQELFTHLVRLTVNVLYDGSAVAAPPPSAAAVDASISSNGNAWAAAGLRLPLNGASGLGPAAVLCQQQLAGFGGVLEAVAHFCAAASIEAQSNLLTVVLHSLAPPDAEEGAVASLVAALCSCPSSLAVLQNVLRASASSAADLHVDELLTVLTQHTDGLDLQLLSAVLLRLEAAVLEGARDAKEAAGELELVMEATERLVRCSGARPAGSGHSGACPAESGHSGVDAQQAWRVLRDLAASNDRLARQLGCVWLQRLILSAFDARTGACPVPPIEAANALLADAAWQQQQQQQQEQQQAGHRRSGSMQTEPDGGAPPQQHMAAALLQVLAGGAPAAEVLLDAAELALVHMKALLLQATSAPGSSSSSRRELRGRGPGLAAGEGLHRRSSSCSNQLTEESARQQAARLMCEMWGSTAQWVSRFMRSSSSSSSGGGGGSRGSSAAGSAGHRQLAVFTRLADMLVQTVCRALPSEALAAAELQLARGSFSAALATSTSCEQLSAVLEAAAAAAAPGASPAALQAARLFLYSHTQGWASLVQPEAAYGIVEVLARVQQLHCSFSAASCGFQGRPSRRPARSSRAAASTRGLETPQSMTASWQGAPARLHPGRVSSSTALGASIQHNLLQQQQQQQQSQQQRRPLRASGISGGAGTAIAAAALLRSSGPLPHNASLESELGAASTVSVASSSAVLPEASSTGASSAPNGAPSAMEMMLAAPWVDEATDSQLALLLLLLGHCAMDGSTVEQFGVDELLKLLLGSRDARQRYYASVYMLKHLMLNEPDRYWRALRQLVLRAQTANDEKVLGNPFLQVSAMMDSL